jgi:Putative Flp pilus-assembly TadE/G-like
MKPPAIRRSRNFRSQRTSESGVTMVLMALTMVAILAMAALSIDVVTLYLANAEAQRSADTAALAAARVLSLTGMTGDPTVPLGRSRTRGSKHARWPLRSRRRWRRRTLWAASRSFQARLRLLFPITLTRNSALHLARTYHSV